MASSKELERLKNTLRIRYNDKPAAQKELAVLEQRIWKMQKTIWKSMGVQVSRKEKYFSREFSVKGGPVSDRANLLSTGAFGEFFWDLAAKERLPIRVGYKLARKARDLDFENSLGVVKACEAVWREYTKGTYQARTATGGITRRKKPRPPPEELPEFSDPEKWDPNISESKRFRGALRTLTEGFVHARLEGIDESIQHDIIRDFEFEVRVAYEDLLKKVNKYRSELKMDALTEVSSSEIRQACECLGVSPPKRGAELDMLQARTKYRKLAAQFHPDRAGKDPKIVRQYHAINEAWEIVQNYMQQFEE